MATFADTIRKNVAKLRSEREEREAQMIAESVHRQRAETFKQQQRIASEAPKTERKRAFAGHACDDQVTFQGLWRVELRRSPDSIGRYRLLLIFDDETRLTVRDLTEGEARGAGARVAEANSCPFVIDRMDADIH